MVADFKALSTLSRKMRLLLPNVLILLMVLYCICTGQYKHSRTMLTCTDSDEERWEGLCQYPASVSERVSDSTTTYLPLITRTLMECLRLFVCTWRVCLTACNYPCRRWWKSGGDGRHWLTPRGGCVTCSAHLSLAACFAAVCRDFIFLSFFYSSSVSVTFTVDRSSQLDGLGQDLIVNTPGVVINGR